MPNCTTVVQIASDLLTPNFNQIRVKNDIFRPFRRVKKLQKSFGIVQLMDAQGIKRAIQDHFLCKLETMIANTVFVGLSGDRLGLNILPPL